MRQYAFSEGSLNACSYPWCDSSPLSSSSQMSSTSVTGLFVKLSLFEEIAVLCWGLGPPWSAEKLLICHKWFFAGLSRIIIIIANFRIGYSNQNLFLSPCLIPTNIHLELMSIYCPTSPRRKENKEEHITLNSSYPLLKPHLMSQPGTNLFPQPCQGQYPFPSWENPPLPTRYDLVPGSWQSSWSDSSFLKCLFV